MVIKSNLDIFTLLSDKFLSNRVLGNITFNTDEGSIIIKEKDIIGNSIQSWLATYFNINEVIYECPSNTQSFPDYIINPNTSYQQNLEIKSWYAEASPAFDIANFDSYIDTLSADAAKLDTDYLIFKYNIEGENIVIEDIYMKKIWEITCPSSKYPLKVQAKRGVIYNIRPATWYSTRTKFQPFENRRDFVRALSETLVQYRGRTPSTEMWFNNIIGEYENITGDKL